ncbi:MAG: pseudouridine synthase [Candidatus Paceibacterota bacterium]
MRINKYLAHKDICSRREADKLIQEGKVLVNGVVATLGLDVQEGDKVEVIDYNKTYFYYAYHKPVGIVSHSPQIGEKSIQEIANFDEDVFPVGRLDKDSRGLIILTNDGRITKKILSPEFSFEKEYIVTLNRPITQKDIEKLRDGVKIDTGYHTKPCRVRRLADNIIKITLTEGKNRQIRRMLKSLKYNVIDLLRIRIGNIELNDIPEGGYRKLSEQKLLGK